MTNGRRSSGLKVNHGLAIVRAKLAGGKRRCYVYAYRGGPCIHVEDGPSVKITPAMLDEAAEIRREQRKRNAHKIEGLIAEYRASPEFSQKADRTRKDYEIWLGEIDRAFGQAPIAAFADTRMRADVLAWRDQWAAKPRTADKAITMMSILLGWAVYRGKLPVNVAAGVKPLWDSNRADCIWTDEDMAAIQPHCSRELWQALRLARFTGLRLGDLVKLEWSHVGDNAIVWITAKRKRRVVIPMLPALAELLAEIGRGDGTVLKNSRGLPWTESGLGGVFQKAKAAAGVKVTIHDMRGTYATWAAQHGLTNEEIARIIGWSPKRIDELRVRYIDEQNVVVSLIERLSAGGRSAK